MALDHFVSQVHLRNFYSPDLDGRKMFAFRKSKLDSFPCDSRDVCRIEEGSTNPYLSEPRLLEEFLQIVEPNYNRACSALLSGKFGYEEIFIVSGFIAFVGGCAPTATRLGSSNLSALVEIELELLERNGDLPPPPLELGATSTLELLNAGKLKIETDRKYPQALGVSNLVDTATAFSSFRWEILRNPHFAKWPFLTSDFPIAVQNTTIPLVRLVPLRPDLGIRIFPIVRPPNQPDDPSDFRYRVIDVTPIAVREFNRQVVRCAEDFVFASISNQGLLRLVKKYAGDRLELASETSDKANGKLLTKSIRIISRKLP